MSIKESYEIDLVERISNMNQSKINEVGEVLSNTLADMVIEDQGRPKVNVGTVGHLMDSYEEQRRRLLTPLAYSVGCAIEDNWGNDEFREVLGHLIYEHTHLLCANKVDAIPAEMSVSDWIDFLG